MIKAIVFDIGGVLIRTEDRSFRQKLEEEYSLMPGDSDKLVFSCRAAQASTLGKADRDLIWESVAKELDLSQDELEEFQTRFWAGDQLDHDLLHFLQDLRPYYTTALLSNAWKSHRQIIKDEFNIVQGQSVDLILISSELGVAKPDPHIYEILADAVECDYDQILFVDDFIENVDAANNLGIQTIYYQPGMNLINEIKSRLDKN